ncbi:MAG TPA: response regulator [Steroidobacteraceae bacterium]|nr:response regulator [Steroidobacteraceae bacterium]
MASIEMIASGASDSTAVPGIRSADRVLIVEDDPTAAMLLARSLRRHGYEAQTAASVQEALEHSAVCNPTAAIVDLRLGRESGLALVPQLAARHSGIRILVLTGYASIATAVQAIKLGASDYLTKPAQLTEILTALRGTRPAQLQPPLNRPSARRFEWEYIQQVLAEQEGNVSATARVLGMQRRTLQRKLAKKPARG